MFGGVKRLLAGTAEPYEKQIATALMREKFDPLMLDELRVLGALVPGSEAFRIMAARNLKPDDAALAIQLASHRYADVKQYTEWLGRRATLHAPTSTQPQAYFLKLLEEVCEVLRLKH
jgi:hypothetical protein